MIVEAIIIGLAISFGLAKIADSMYDLRFVRIEHWVQQTIEVEERTDKTGFKIRF